MPSNVLSIPLKVSPLPSAALSRALRNYIAESFHDTHPDAFNDDFKDIAKMRDQVSRMDVHIANIDAALKYQAQLVFLGSKFPPDINLAFPWSVSFPTTLPLFSSDINGEDDSPPASPSTLTQIYSHAKSYIRISGETYVVAHPDLHYERAAVLFSLAALHSSIGASESRKEADSIKRSLNSFQISAGILDYILTQMAPLISHLSSGMNSRNGDPDLKPAMLGCLKLAMLAQAQECLWQYSLAQGKRDVIIAMLATEVSDLYSKALDCAANGIISQDDGTQNLIEEGGCELPKDWINHMTVKKWHFAASAQYRKSCEDLGANRYGDELGRLKLADVYARKALDSIKRGTSQALQADLKSLQGIISSSLSRASKDNDLIYLETVTPPSSLAPIPAKNLAKIITSPEIINAIAFLRDGPVPALGKPLFKEIVPYGVHVAISVFEDRKESFIRDEFEAKREDLDKLASSSLQSLNLPGSLQALDQPVGLPPSLVRKSEDVQSEGGYQRLEALAGDIARVSRVDEDILREIQSILRQEEIEDENAKSSMAIVRSDEQGTLFREKANEFEQTMVQARDSDGLVRDKMRDWEDLIVILSSGYDGLMSHIPQQTRVSSMNQTQNSAVRALRVELEGLDDLIDSRAALVEEIKAMSRRHDIRPAIMREAGVLASGNQAPMKIEARHFEPLFEVEMQSFEKMLVEMQESEKAQEERLEIIRQCNEDFLESRKTDGGVQKREEALQAMDLSYSKYRELSANLTEGLKFYNQLAKLMSELRDGIKQWHWSRQMDISELSDKMKANNINDGINDGHHQDRTKAATPSRIKANASSASTPISTTKRTTRSQVKAKGEEEEAKSIPPQPQWDAWKGGDIRFND